MRLVLPFVFAFLAVFVSPPLAEAKQKSGRQTRASGPEIYRIELRNIGNFRVRADGEPESDGELHSISVSLLEPKNTRDRQYDTVAEKAPLLVNLPRTERAGSSYLTIQTGDLVRLGERRGSQSDYNLWTHSAYRNLAEDGNYLRFFITVTARELDCGGRRVCDRGNIGTVTHTINIPPLREVPPRDCQPQNTFTWTTVDEWEVLQGNSKLNGRILMTQSYNDRRDFTGFDATSIGPFMDLMNAEVCIARTW